MTQIDHPSYYSPGKYECIDVIESAGLGEGFCLGNAIKYISRAGKKTDSDTMDDLKKALWYLDRFIKENPSKVAKRFRGDIPATMSGISLSQIDEIGRAWNLRPSLQVCLEHILTGKYQKAAAILRGIVEPTETPKMQTQQ